MAHKLRVALAFGIIEKRFSHRSIHEPAGSNPASGFNPATPRSDEMLWAQWTILLVLAVTVGVRIATYGKTKTTTVDAGDFIGIAIAAALYLCAGAFDRIFSWPL